MFCQSQAFPTEKNRFVWLFLIFKKSQRCLNKARISKYGFKQSQSGNPGAPHCGEVAPSHVMIN